MPSSESSRFFFFKFLRNRRIDFTRLEGVVYDHACGLQSVHRYIFNQEPAQFQNIRFLVDGSHWKTQKKFKKSNKKSEGQDGPDDMRNSQSMVKRADALCLGQSGEILEAEKLSYFFPFAIRNM